MRQPSSRETPAPARATFLASFRFAWQGLAYVLRTQRNARIHLTVGAAVVGVGLLLRLPPSHLAILVVCAMVVIVAEMSNTVVESVVDLATPHYHPLAKIAKDVAAGTVLFAAGSSVVVGLLVLGPPLWHAIVP